MKVLCLHTYTDCWNKMASLEALGHEIIREQYDDRPHERHGELVDLARRVAPDFILYIGAPGEEHHHRPVPKADVLAAINRVAPMVHMCDDAADHPWWPLIDEYFRENSFTVQVAIDGGGESPIAHHPQGMCLLTPIDPRPFQRIRWDDRKNRRAATLIGGWGHGERGQVMQVLSSHNMLEFYKGPETFTYDAMAAELCRTRLVFNHPMTGTGTRMHVKGRVVEAGFAGACLLERHGSPTAKWFLPGVHYLPYDGAEDAVRIVRDTPDTVLEEMADLLHFAVVAEHHPRIFWERVLAKVKEVRSCTS